MIIKKREIPLFIQKLQALLRRIPLNHPQYPKIQEQLKKSLSGYKGELSIDYPLTLLPQDRYYILHDLRLQHNSKNFFQIDCLLLSQNFVLIIEVKNISGTLYFDPVFHQLIRTKDGLETAFPDPLIQVRRQESQLKWWFLHNKLAQAPIISLIVISNPKTLIRTSSKNNSLNKTLIHRDVLPSQIEYFEKKYPKDLLTEKDLKKAVRLLKKQNNPSDFSILDHFQILKNEVLQGAVCCKCGTLPLKRMYGTWVCLKCSHNCKQAHKEAIRDFFLLIQPTITSRELKDFLLISSPALATRLLATMNLPYEGSTKGRVYRFSDGFII